MGGIHAGGSDTCSGTEHQQPQKSLRLIRVITIWAAQTPRALSVWTPVLPGGPVWKNWFIRKAAQSGARSLGPSGLSILWVIRTRPVTSTIITWLYPEHLPFKVKWRSLSCVQLFCDPHGLYSPWNSPGQNTGVGSLSLLQGSFPTQGSNPGLPHCRRTLYQLNHKGSPSKVRDKQDNTTEHIL